MDRIKHKNLLVLMIVNIVLFLPLMVFGGENYSIDSYGILLSPNEHITNFVGAYRYFGALVYKIIMFTGHNPILNATVDITIFIVTASVMVTILVVTVANKAGINSLWKIGILDAAAMLSILNVWFCDILSFPECIILTTVGMVLCYGAVLIYVRYETYYSCIISGILLICATAVYQQFISMYVIFLIAILGMKILTEKRFSAKDVIGIYYKPAVTVIISGIIYYLIGKIIANLMGLQENSRIALSFDSIFQNIRYFIRHQHSYLKGRGYFSSEFLTISFLVLGLVWFVLLIKQWLKNKNTVHTLIIGLSYIAAYCSAYLPGILSTSHAARAMFALFSVFVLFAFGIAAMTDSRFINAITTVFLVIILVVNTVKVLEGELTLKKQNQQDEQWAVQIINEINEYEEDSDCSIRKIVFCNDLEADGYRESARNIQYAMKAILTIHAEREFEYSVMPDEIYDRYFAEQDWDECIPSEQMVFEGDTLYLCCY